MPERNLPASAIDLLDRSMASVKIEKEMEQTTNDESNTIILKKDEVRNVVAKMTGIPMGNIQSEERQRLSSAEDILHKRVVGQNHAIKSILDAVFESRSGLNKKGQPIGSFFFLGPTGTGKTELAKSLAEFLFNDASFLQFWKKIFIDICFKLCTDITIICPQCPSQVFISVPHFKAF